MRSVGWNAVSLRLSNPAAKSIEGTEQLPKSPMLAPPVATGTAAVLVASAGTLTLTASDAVASAAAETVTVT